MLRWPPALTLRLWSASTLVPTMRVSAPLWMFTVWPPSSLAWAVRRSLLLRVVVVLRLSKPRELLWWPSARLWLLWPAWSSTSPPA